MKPHARFRIVLLLLAFVLFFTGASVAGTNVKVMTYNVDEGTDFGPIISVLTNPDATNTQVQGAITNTIDQVVNSNPVLRMQFIAQEIAAAQPDLVGLQEAAVWTFPTVTGTETVDFLQLIQADLVALGQSYTAVVQPEFQIDLTGQFGVAFTDRDVILVRSDVFDSIVGNQGHYRAHVPLSSSYLPGVDGITRGWASVDLARNGTTFRFITTHLEDGTNTLSPIFLFVQALQEIELVSSPSGPVATAESPVIIGGDFNTVANDPTSPTYLTYLFMLGNGFTDAWKKAHPFLQGATCCQQDLTAEESVLTQRIDQIFARNGARVIGTQLVGNHLDTILVDGVPESSWPSDHAAVASELKLSSLP